MNLSESFTRKWRSLAEILDAREKHGILLDTQASVAWLTGARSFINIAATKSVLQLYVTREQVHVVVNNIEAKRIEEEECPGLLGAVLAFESFPWYKADGANQAVERLISGRSEQKVDESDLALELRELQSVLDPYEQAVLKTLANETAQAVEEVAREFPFHSREFEVAGRLSAALWSRGIEPIVLLVSGDERTRLRRHPLPTDKLIEDYAILSVCGRRHGLVASVTRSVQRGAAPAALRKKQEAAAFVDASALAYSRPGELLQDVFAEICQAYESQGFAEQWKFHHQGGLTGYASRTQLALPSIPLLLKPGMALAFNPTVEGAKSEDTCLLEGSGAVILSQTAGQWPMIPVQVSGKTWLRPAILER